MQIDGEEGWVGGGVEEGGVLEGVLDDVLNLADMWAQQKREEIML